MAGGKEVRTKEKKQRESFKKYEKNPLQNSSPPPLLLCLLPQRIQQYFSSNSSLFAPILVCNGCFQTGSLLTPFLRTRLFGSSATGEWTGDEKECLPLPQSPNDKKEKDILLGIPPA